MKSEATWCRIMVAFVSRSYRGDQGLQTLLLGADIFGGINHCPCGAAAVELRGGNQNTVLVPPAVYLTDLIPNYSKYCRGIEILTKCMQNSDI